MQLLVLLSFSHSTLISFKYFKKGDINSPDNYRGISLLNVSGKLYSYILNKRLTTWLEDNRLIMKHRLGSERVIVQSIMFLLFWP